MSENEENFKELNNPHFLPADHHLLEPMQRDMTKQLESELEMHLLDLNQKNNILKKLKKDTENKGTQLYVLQQNLNKLQESIQQENQAVAKVSKQKTENDIRLKEIEEEHEKRKKEKMNIKKRLWKTMDELSKQNSTIKQIEEHQKVLTSEIKITRRITYKIEEDIELIGNIKYKAN